MSTAGPHFESRGSVQGYNVLQGVTAGDHTTFNFLDSSKGGAPQNEKEACLRTLGFLEIEYREQDISDAVEHTCEWLFDTPQFQKWRDRIDLATNNGVLCIKGKPGAGKSTLMKHTLEHCKKIFHDNLIIAYFFNARGSILEKSPVGMLRSITYQLVKQDDTLFDQFLVRFREKNITCQDRGWEWRQRELKAFITSVIKSGKLKPLLLIVDALDECNDADMQDVVDFLESLSIDAIKSGTTLRICLSRRHYPPLRIAKCLELIVENNEDHREDIATYIRAKLANRDPQIEAKIEKMSNGIFMWVVLVVRLLNKASLKIRDKKKTMRDALEKIPGELEEVFQMLFNKDDEDMAETVLMLQWVLFAERPLTPVELYAAVEAGDTGSWSQSTDIDHESIQPCIERLSKGLIEIRSGDDRPTVQFIHLSVYDFLLRNKRLQRLDPALEPDPVTASHYHLWTCCWSHVRSVMGTCTEEAWKDLCSESPFLGYAASYIFDHADNALGGGLVGQAGATIERWLRDSSSWLEWWKSFLNATYANDGERYAYNFSRKDMDAGLLYVLSDRGYRCLVKCVLTRDGEEGADGVEVNAQGGKYGTALQAASWRGNQHIVELLLKAGAEVNAQGGEYGNALQAASLKGDQQIVELLLQVGAEVNAQSGELGNALQAASFTGDQQIVELLLKAGAEVNAQGGYFGTVLQGASYGGHQRIVELLLKAGAEVNTQGGYFGNALQAASYGGRQRTVELLLKAGAKVNAQGGYYGNALQAASVQRYQHIVELLLEAGATPIVPRTVPSAEVVEAGEGDTESVTVDETRGGDSPETAPAMASPSSFHVLKGVQRINLL